MKNDDQMYQSVLSRYAEYQETKKKQRKQTIRRTVPVFACFCFVVVFGLGYWEHLEKLPNIPIRPNIAENQTTDSTQTTSSADIADTTESSPTVQGKQTEPASTAISPTQTETNETSANGTSPTAATGASNDETEHEVTATDPQETNFPADTEPVIQTEPITKPQTMSPVQIPVETQTVVTEPEQIVTETTEAVHPEPGQIVTETTEAVHPIEPPAQPIRFDTIGAAADAVNASDISSYPEYEQASYRYLFDRIRSDGFLYQVNNSDTVSLIKDRGITLFPYAAYEDVGIGCYVSYKDMNYHITFYYADRDLTARTTGIAEYLQSRMGRRSDKAINVAGRNVSLFFAANGQTYAGGFMDNEHYFAVNTAASEEEVIEFLGALCFEQIPL